MAAAYSMHLLSLFKTKGMEQFQIHLSVFQNFNFFFCFSEEVWFNSHPLSVEAGHLPHRGRTGFVAAFATIRPAVSQRYHPLPINRDPPEGGTGFYVTFASKSKATRQRFCSLNQGGMPLLAFPLISYNTD
ncbi:hypothetical protein SAMN05444285_10918 [Draconibacterium orientale]|uniref:Uncharacterized protein n=1 Tax=Draconibacterium orientale TaxID=1168034 RepID=X5E2L4_9BACT|nr:hypothetical protein FH5T_06850 [Draconibacterium orientale]SET26380.1 hypothetical protein SAMN05444285_10918 [Draconibacterium orientale]